MARTIEYEWVGELIELYSDGEEEILDSEYLGSYAAVREAVRIMVEREAKQYPDRTYTEAVALVRYVLEDGYEKERDYVYVQNDNRLPHTYACGTAVPIKYRKEVDTFHQRVEWSRYEATTSIADLLTEYDTAREQAERARKYANWCCDQRRGPAEDREYFYEMSQASRAEAQRWTDRMAAIGLRLDVLMPNRPAEG